MFRGFIRETLNNQDDTLRQINTLGRQVSTWDTEQVLQGADTVRGSWNRQDGELATVINNVLKKITSMPTSYSREGNPWPANVRRGGVKSDGRMQGWYLHNNKTRLPLKYVKS